MFFYTKNTLKVISKFCTIHDYMYYFMVQTTLSQLFYHRPNRLTLTIF